MGILMAGLSPHPPLIVPEIGKERRSAVKKTIQNLEELAAEIVECDPDILITISPHGPVFSDAIGVMNQPELSGDFSDFSCPEVELTVKTDENFISVLKKNAERSGIELISLSSGGLRKYNYPCKLDHGVLVPLYFMKEAGLNVPVIPITMGLLSYEKLYKFGGTIQETISEQDLNAVIVASGDLSHRLKPGAPAGYNPRGEEFDKRLINLLSEEKYKQVMEIDSRLIEKAGECGLRPIIIMLGALQGLSVSSEVKSYEGPFGVGYGIVGFYPDE
ncbi:MAG: AmmeMemoRadiSam system protein B [Halanaerobiaceae bacterium]